MLVYRFLSAGDWRDNIELGLIADIQVDLSPVNILRPGRVSDIRPLYALAR